MVNVAEWSHLWKKLLPRLSICSLCICKLSCIPFWSLGGSLGLIVPVPVNCLLVTITIYEPRCEKTGLRGFRPGPTQTRLYSHRRWLES